jgi:hypothetical protein
MRQGNLLKERLIDCRVLTPSGDAACTEQTAFSLLRGLLTVKALLSIHVGFVPQALIAYEESLR